MAPARTVYLIDGSAQFHRAYFAIRGLATSRGLPTNATYGFTTMLRKLYQDEKPEWVGISFDLPGAHLPPRGVQGVQGAPADDGRRPGACSCPTCAGSARPSACRCIDVPGFEADDVIATLARQAVERGLSGGGGLGRQGPAAARDRRRAGAEPRAARASGATLYDRADGRGEVRRAARARGGRAGPRGRRGGQRPGRARASATRARATWSASSARSRRCSTTPTRSSAPPTARACKAHREDALLSKQPRHPAPRRAGRPSSWRRCGSRRPDRARGPRALHASSSSWRSPRSTRRSPRRDRATHARVIDDRGRARGRWWRRRARQAASRSSRRARDAREPMRAAPARASALSCERGPRGLRAARRTRRSSCRRRCPRARRRERCARCSRTPRSASSAARGKHDRILLARAGRRLRGPGLRRAARRRTC